MAISDVDERLFGWVHRRLRSLARREDPASEHAVALEPIAGRLALLASALAGVPFEVRAAEHSGGVRGAVLLLPSCVDRHDSGQANLDVYLFRVAYGVQSRALGFSMAGIAPHLRTLASLLAAPATRRALARELPTAITLLAELRIPTTTTTEASALVDTLLYEHHMPACWLELMTDPPSDQPGLVARCGELATRSPTLVAALDAAAVEHMIVFGQLFCAVPSPIEPNTPGNIHATPPAPGGTERQAPPRDEVELVTLAKDPEHQNPLVHSFEQVHTLDDYKGGSRHKDGEDQLEDQLDALDELDLRQLVRTNETSNSVYRADGLFEGSAGNLHDDSTDTARPHRHYDEWDSRKRKYRRDWCTLYLDSAPSPADSVGVASRLRRVRSAHAKQLHELRAALEALEIERRWRTRQLDGPELDLDAVVLRHSAIAAGCARDERVHAARRRHEREVATLILLDLSLSSDSYVDGRRILDVGQDALIVLGDVLDRASDQFAVAGFFSHTRRDCRWLPLKSFEASWSASVPRLLAVKPTGYTRIGPALRHGMHTLVTHPARRRLLLLITDGRPSDYDQYEGRHGVDDVRQAFQEAEGQGVHPFAITIAEQPTPALARMFGGGRFETLRTPDALPNTLAQVYARLAR